MNISRSFLIGAAAALFISVPLTRSVTASERGGFPIETGGTCISSTCHADFGKKQYIHDAASDGSMCADCHEIQQEGVHTFTLIADGGEVCAECHDSMADKKYVHSIVEEGECLGCHDPHQSDNPKLLILPETSELCSECHDSMADKKFVHSIVEEGECLGCHDPHQSDNPKQLILPATSKLCAKCHDDEFEGNVSHGPVKRGECLDCHSPHATDYPNQLIMAVPHLCFNCHKLGVIDTKGITIPSPKSLYEDSEALLHRPFVEGKCNTCHFPHGGDRYRLLKGNYPTAVYSPYSDEVYSLCLGCHKDMAQSLEKPRTLGGTKFRNGNLNLHHRHVNKKKGRTCRSCHDHHGSKNPRLIKETFKIRKMELPMEFSLTETGGSCTPSCHISVRYDRYEPVDVSMKTTQREGKDATPSEIETSRKLDRQSREQGMAKGGEEIKNLQ